MLSLLTKPTSHTEEPKQERRNQPIHQCPLPVLQGARGLTKVTRVVQAQATVRVLGRAKTVKNPEPPEKEKELQATWLLPRLDNLR